MQLVNIIVFKDVLYPIFNDKEINKQINFALIFVRRIDVTCEKGYTSSCSICPDNAYG